MFTIQYHRVTGNTTEASAKAIELLKAPGYKHAVFSVSPKADDGTATNADGPDTNWPYFVAAIRVGDDVYVFDSVLLNAARLPRDREVRAILDAAVAAGHVHFTADGKSYFTASLSPEQAARILCDRPLQELNTSTRRDYFVSLSYGMTEEDFDRLRGS